MLLTAIFTAVGIALKTLILLQHYDPSTQLVGATLYLPTLNILSLSVVGLFMLGAIYIGLKNQELLPAKDGRKNVLVNALSGFFLFSTLVLQILYVIMELPLGQFSGILHYMVLVAALPASLYFLYPIFRENYNRTTRAFFGIALMLWCILSLISLNLNVDIHLRGLTRDWNIYALVALMVYFLCELKVELKHKPMRTQFFAGFCAVFFAMVNAMPRIVLAFTGTLELSIDTIYNSVIVALGIYVFIAILQMKSRLQECEVVEEQATDENLPEDWRNITFVPAIDEPVLPVPITEKLIRKQGKFRYKIKKANSVEEQINFTEEVNFVPIFTPVELEENVAAVEEADVGLIEEFSQLEEDSVQIEEFSPLDFTVLDLEIPSDEEIALNQETLTSLEEASPLDFTMLDLEIPNEEVAPMAEQEHIVDDIMLEEETISVEESFEPIVTEEAESEDFVPIEEQISPMDFTALDLIIPSEEEIMYVENEIASIMEKIALVDEDEQPVEEVSDLPPAFDFTLSNLEISEEPASAMDYTLSEFGLAEVDFVPIVEQQPTTSDVAEVMELPETVEAEQASEAAPEVQPSAETSRVRRRPTRIPVVKKDDSQ